MVDMSVTLADVDLPNPLMTASGCAANGKEQNRFFDVSTLGAYVTKSLMAAPRSGMVAEASGGHDDLLRRCRTGLCDDCPVHVEVVGGRGLIHECRGLPSGGLQHGAYKS